MKTYYTKVLMITIFASLYSCRNQSESNTMKTNESAQTTNRSSRLLPGIQAYLDSIESDFLLIPEDRKRKLEELSSYIKSNNSKQELSNLIFICTHNSRRSHMSQLWAQAAACFYGVSDTHCYSGGIETTAFNHRAVKALQKAGFSIEQTDTSSNPVYLVKYASDVEPVKAFSKKFSDDFNPKSNFAAVMTCSDADAACPFVPGASIRIAIPYMDPKEADNTPGEESKYDERCRQIAAEMFYVFSLV